MTNDGLLLGTSLKARGGEKQVFPASAWHGGAKQITWGHWFAQLYSTKYANKNVHLICQSSGSYSACCAMAAGLFV